jgi:UDP-N-acetylglucosamine--N-acetylmuramyl-(pentapeptide) pyrophosphoryl-undecaprenol N-acetylglucosamine transferase
VYPALAVFQALNAKRSDIEILWVGGENGMEAELVKRAGLPYTSIPAAGLHGVGLRALPRNLTQLARGVLYSQKILRDFHPDVLFFTGGYVAGAMAFAGRRVPTLLYVPDIEPGLALKSLARFADCIAVSAEDSQKYFARKVVVTGYPLRADLETWTKNSGRAALNLDANKPVLLVVGGSKGARSINQAVLSQLPALLKTTQVVHITGQLDWKAVEIARASLPLAQRKRYQTYPYLHEEMGAALAAADLVIARAGASALGEFTFFGLPAILVPYPHAWRYQKVNADYLMQRDAAIIVKDELLQSELFKVVTDLIMNPSKRKAMQTAMRSLMRPQAAQAIAEQLLELGGAHK